MKAMPDDTGKPAFEHDEQDSWYLAETESLDQWTERVQSRGVRSSEAPKAAWAVWLTVAGATAWMVGYVVALPPVVLLVAAGSFVAGTCLVAVLTYQYSRANQIGYGRALWHALRASGRWVFDNLP